MESDVVTESSPLIEPVGPFTEPTQDEKPEIPQKKLRSILNNGEKKRFRSLSVNWPDTNPGAASVPLSTEHLIPQWHYLATTSIAEAVSPIFVEISKRQCNVVFIMACVVGTICTVLFATLLYHIHSKH